MAPLPRESKERISKARWAGWGVSARCGRPSMAYRASEGEERKKGSDEPAGNRERMGLERRRAGTRPTGEEG